MISIGRYNPANWYWAVGGSTTQVYASASNSVVAVSDATYVAWMAVGNFPTKIDTAGSLFAVLATLNPTSAQMVAFGTAFAAIASLADLKTILQGALDALFNVNFDLAKFIRAGSVTTVTAAGVGTFLATITNNYRSLRASIAAAANVAALQAININAGWPANP